MILSVLVALLTALGPLLRGSWDLWAQSLLQSAVIAGLSLWLIAHVFIGHIPLPSRRVLVWTLISAALGAVSAALSPLHASARQGWHNQLCALLLFPAMSALSKDQRSGVDQAIRVSGWTLMALAFYQHFSLGEQRPPSALLNQNVYAGAVLLFLPLAVEKGDWLLAVGLIWTLWWTRSVGAWLGLCAALAITGRRDKRWWSWIGGAGVLICAVAIYGKLGSTEALHRWWWWKAAARMALARPWFGNGPGTFAYILPAYLPSQSGGLNSLYAHQYFLETMAECGLAFALVWFAGIGRCVFAPLSHKRFGVIAILIQSLWDYPLSIPALLWLFSYFAASSIPDGSDGVNITARRKLPAVLAIAGLGVVLSSRALDDWRGGRLAVSAQEALESGDLDSADLNLREAARRAPDDPEIPRLAAAVAIRRAMSLPAGADRGAWVEAAARLEAAVRLNPYRRSNWTELALAYRRIGRSDAAESVLAQAAPYQAQP